MNAGELNNRVDILSLIKSGSAYAWQQSAAVWAKAERTERIAVFSAVGVGKRSVKLTLRRRLLTLDNAVRWKNQHGFLTDIVETPDSRYLEVTTALIEPISCSVTRETTTVDQTTKRPSRSTTSTLSFPACLTEKYLGRAQSEPMAVDEVRYVLVTPKVIELKSGEVVTVGGKTYTVVALHTLDMYKNEYEISRTGEA